MTLTNSAEWIFAGVDGRYSVTLISAAKSEMPSGDVLLCGPFYDLPTFVAGRMTSGAIKTDLLRSASAGAAFPQLPDAKSAEVFAQLRLSPRLDAASHGFEFRPVAEFHATNDRSIFDAGEEAPGRWPVVGGSGFNLWEPETGEYYAWADPKVVTAVLQEKRQKQIRLKKSAFFGMDPSWASDPATLPCRGPRIAFRDVTNATNTRTCIAALVPGERVLTNKAPYLLRLAGAAADEAFLLGVLSSIPLDWYARRYVELGMNFHIFNGLPVPSADPGDPLRVRLIELAGRLAARDVRFSGWASEVGVPVASISSPQAQAEAEAEIDAVVAALYGLQRDQLEHIFSTFHRGWDFAPRLATVLGYFDAI